MIKIIYDFDGVILDDTDHAIQQHETIAISLNIAAPSANLVKKHWGKPWEKGIIPAIAQALQWTAEEQEKFIKQYYTEHLARKAKPIPKVNRIFRDLINNNYLLSIISSRDQHTLGIKLSELKINKKHFYLIQSREECYFAKPSGRVFYPLFNKLASDDIAIEKIIYVGDSIRMDYQAIKNLQKPSHQKIKSIKRYIDGKIIPIHFIGVTTMHTKEKFNQASVHTVINSLENLPHILTQL